VPGFETLFVYDVTHQWREMTDKPSVLAFWAGRKDLVSADVTSDFLASKRYGTERIREISEAASIKLDLPPRALDRYLTENINFDLEEDNLAGLQLYFEKAASHGLTPRARALEFAVTDSGSAVRRGA
jgi:predicted solute-binding protein